MADYILTYTKKKFQPLEPISEDIDIVDIAHALSLMTRANGHFESFYSVAQHCVNCCKEAAAIGYSERVQLGCLLHDASESYISDLTRPVKKNLPEYYVIEKQLQKAIYECFGLADLSPEEEGQIREIDDAMLYYEFVELMGEKICEAAPGICSKPDFEQRDFKKVEKEFLSTFKHLTGKKAIGFSCVGIDACNGKWVAVHISGNGFEVDKYDAIADICKRYPECDSYLIDIPVGLPESNNDIRPDPMVRKQLGRKGSSIFQVPCRQAVYATDKEEARVRNKDAIGKSLSEQSIAITKAIRQVDEFIEQNPQWKNRLMESHPEFCFLKLNGGSPILENKKLENGKIRRLEVLRRYYSNADAVVDKFLADVPLRKKTDDVVDALCLAVMGKQIIEQGIRTVPEIPMADSRGIMMRIVYAE